jgi:hypothetical protein
MKKIIRLTEGDINRIVRRVLKENESTVDTKELLKKINGILVPLIQSDLKNIVSDVKVKFGFDSNQNLEMYDDLGNLLTMDSDGWGGKTENIFQPIVYIKEINSLDYIDDVENTLNEDEVSAFNEVGRIEKFSDRSLKDLMTDGKILIWIKPLSNVNIMGWQRTKTNAGSSEDVACSDVGAKYDNLGDEIPYSDILFLQGESISGSKKICNGGAKISNSGIGIGIHKPINDIINTNK